MYFNTQEEIITKISKSLEKSLILRKKVIKNDGYFFAVTFCCYFQNKKSSLELFYSFGSEEWIRTADLPGMNRMLQPTELLRHKS